VYIDLNMVRAGVVNHPVKWAHNGYHEIHEPPKRYAVIDLQGLVALCGFARRKTRSRGRNLLKLLIHSVIRPLS
jgi:putative transposase